jgi:hypothetical protein
VRFTAPKSNFAGLIEKVAEWNATVISKDESGTQPSIVSIFSVTLSHVSWYGIANNVPLLACTISKNK